MSVLSNSRALGAAFCFLLEWTVLDSGAVAQESIKLRNSMQSPITVLIQSKQKAAPVNVRIRVDDTYEYKLKDEGPYTIQVVPDDEPDSGYDLGSHDLRQVAKALQGRALELEGEFTTYLNPQSRTLFEVRTAVHFDVPIPGRGLALRTIGPRAHYKETKAGSGQDESEPQPTDGTAVIAALVPQDARVVIDGHNTTSAGAFRYFRTPILGRGKTFRYKMKVEWNKDGHACAAEQEVEVRSGGTSRVYFRLPINSPSVLLVPAITGEQASIPRRQ